MKEIKSDRSADDEQAVLKECQQLFEREAKAKKAVAQSVLDEAVFERYPRLSEEGIKTLVAEDKWHATLQGMISAEIERITQQLANRIKDLEKRYAEPLPMLEKEVEVLSIKVGEHLRKMGLKW